MNLRATAALACSLGLAACGGGHHDDDGEKIPTGDANALMEAVIIKIGGLPTTSIAGTPPDTSEDAAKPIAKVSGSDVTVAPGGVAGVELTLTPDALATMCKVFAKIGGADTFAVADLDCPSGKAAKAAGTPFVGIVSVQLPRSVDEGRFCMEFSGADDQGRVSNVVERCINVDENPGGGTAGNVPPVAEAGADRSVAAGQSVVLTAIGSRDSDGSLTTFHWEQVGGTPVDLQGADTPFASFAAPASSATLTFTLTVTDDRGDQAQDSVIIDVGVTNPSVALSVLPNAIASGQSATLQWTSSNATSCAASGDWAGARATSGSQSVAPSVPGSYTYTLTCDGAAGTTPAVSATTLTVTVLPTINLTVTPTGVMVDQNATLQWTSTGTTACTASDAWTGAKATSGNQSTSQPGPGLYTYTLTCNVSGGGTISDSVDLPVETDYEVNPANDHEYRVANCGNWTQCEAQAVTEGGHLVAIADATEQQYLVDSFGGSVFWIGLSDQQAEGTFTWTTGEPVTFTNWAPGEPNDQGGEDFAVQSDADQLGLWNDLAGNAAFVQALFERIPAGPQEDLLLSLDDATLGANPFAGLVEADDGNLYGATCAHGAGGGGDGTIFRVTLPGTASVVHDFVSATDGACPQVSLIRGANAGELYGVASMGGLGGCAAPGCGTVFKVTTADAFQVLHAFDGTTGIEPTSLILATDGNYYGTTRLGGTLPSGGQGTVFQMTPAGAVTVLYTFAGGSLDGSEPNGLMEDPTAPGRFYGLTRKGGPADAGTMFKLESGVVTIQFFFDGTQAGSPVGRLVQGVDNKLYGTAAQGQSVSAPPNDQDRGVLFRIDRSGANFEILHKFLDDGSDGDSPVSGMIFVNGLLYGTTLFGGADGAGAVFRMAPDGSGYTVLHSFESLLGDGFHPQAGLVLGSDGKLYGTTFDGGANGVGTVFAITNFGP